MNGRFVAGSTLVILGVFFLLENAGVLDFREALHDYWPVLLILGGIWLLVRRRSAAKERPIAAPQSATASLDWLNESSTFGDVSVQSSSKNFAGGTINGVFGRIFLDAGGVVLAEGEQTLTINGVFGDARVTLPKDIPISVKATTVFGRVTVNETRRGGFSPVVTQESPAYATAARKLRVDVTTVFGDVEVRH